MINTLNTTNSGMTMVLTEKGWEPVKFIEYCPPKWWLDSVYDYLKNGVQAWVEEQYDYCPVLDVAERENYIKRIFGE